MKDILIVVSALIVVLAIIIGAAIGLGYFLESRACEAKAARMEMRHEFGLFLGCMVFDEGLGKWRPLNQRRQVE